MLPLAFIQNFGPWEWLLVAVVVLLLFGNRLPGLGRSLGRSVNEFKTGLKEGAEETPEGAKDAQTASQTEAGSKEKAGSST